MKKFNKLLAITLAIVICLLSVFAIHFFAAGVLDGYVYDLDDHGRAILVGWDNSSDILYVPAYIGNFRVIEIGNSAFKNDDYIHTLDLSGATYCDAIGMYAFAGSALEGELVIPTRVTSIGTSAFERCNSLTYVSYSSFGETVSAQCFQYCENLKTVVLTEYITAIERYAFYNCPNLTSVTIPKSVTSINSTAFLNDENLTIYCYYDSYAHHYAEDYGINYEILDPWNTPTEPPTDPPTEAPTEPPTEPEPQGYLLGDTDNDDNVDVVDATWVQRAVAEMDIAPVQATVMQGNVDGDDLLTVIDATFIMRYTVNIATPYAIGERVVNS